MLSCKASSRKLIVTVRKAALQMESVAGSGLRHALSCRGEIILLDSMLTLQQGAPVFLLLHRSCMHTR